MVEEETPYFRLICPGVIFYCGVVENDTTIDD